MDAFGFKARREFVDATAESLKRRHVTDLTTDVEMQSDALDMAEGLGSTYRGYHVLHGEAKLVFLKASGDFSMCVRIDIGIDAECYSGDGVPTDRTLVDGFKFGK